LDDRVNAHLDGLRIAADAGWAACEEELGWAEPGEVFAPAVLAFEAGNQRRIQTVLEVGGQSYELSRPIVSALGWLRYQQASDHVQRFLAAEESLPRRIGIAACAVHRRDPGQKLVEALDDPDVLLQARAIRAVGELGGADLLPELRPHLAAEDRLGRFAAAWSVGLLAGDGAAIEALRATVEENGRNGQKALQLALRRMDIAEAKDWINGLAKKPELARPAVIGAGVLGVPDLVPWLMEQMQVPELARLAGEGFTMITGVDLSDQKLEGGWPEGFVAGPTEDPKDEDVEMDPDENLPWPDHEKVVDWWQKNRDRFEQGTRYLVGRPMTIEWLNHVLRNGYQRQRAAAALELAIRQPVEPLFEVRAPGWRQRQMLA
jgi:uncharacterized protein (TIGR02270 family)